jgi:putative acetyltransferase
MRFLLRNAAMVIRDEQAADLADIRDLVTAAFRRPDEAGLVDRLRHDGDLVLSLIAVENGTVMGCALFSPMTAPFRALALGPLAVRRDCQRQGIGRRLVQAGIDRVRQAEWRALFVLGDPNYYRRFGFDPAFASGFTCRYAGPHLMALPLGAALPTTTGAIDYAPAFRDLD